MERPLLLPSKDECHGEIFNVAERIPNGKSMAIIISDHFFDNIYDIFVRKSCIMGNRSEDNG